MKKWILFRIHFFFYVIIFIVNLLTILIEHDNLYQVKLVKKIINCNSERLGDEMLLSKAKIGHRARIEEVKGKDKTKKFLFTLGCFEGEEITLISKLAGNFVINVKDGRYAIDEGMAKSIVLNG